MGPAHGFHSSDRVVQSYRPSGGSLPAGYCHDGGEGAGACSKRMMLVHIKFQMTIRIHSPNGIHRALEVSLQLGRGQMRVCLHGGRRQPGWPFLGPCLSEGRFVRQPPEDIDKVAEGASSNRRRPEPRPANLGPRQAKC
jgi:hypothetical protein